MSIPPEIEALRGKEYVYQAAEEVGRGGIRMFALSINHRDPLFYDQEVARQSKYRGIVAPPTYICETWQYRNGDMTSEGHTTDWVDVPVGRVLRAGNEYEFFRPLRPKDVITAHMLVSDVVERAGKAGPMIFVTFQYEFKNQRGQLLARHRETMVALLTAEKL